MFRNKKAYIFIFVALLVWQGAAVPQAEKRPMTFEDVLKIKRAGDPQWSPDGHGKVDTLWGRRGIQEWVHDLRLFSQ